MKSDFQKIKICLIGTGEWGSQVENVLTLLSRYNFVGSINTSTDEFTKNSILEQAEIWYIALPKDSQFEYIKQGILSDKHIICETPVGSSIKQRKEIYDLILSKNGSKKIFYCNFPYFLDKDFAQLLSGGILRKAKYFSVKCYGPKFKDRPEEAKKFYVTQAFNIILNCTTFLNVRNFDKFIIRDNFCGELQSVDSTFLFEWGYNEYPKLDLTVKGEDFSKTAEFVYDKYDQIMPMLLSFSDKILNVTEHRPDLESYMKAAEAQGADMYNRLSIASFLTACTAEYYSEIFNKTNGEYLEILDPLKLILNGGFSDPDMV
jgi:hypothetical protein